MAKNNKPHVPHASNKWWGKRRYLNCAHPPVNSPEKSICPVCEYGTSDMQRDPLQAMCRCDCATELEADEQLRVSLRYGVDLGYGGLSPDEPQPAKYSQRFEPRGVIMQDPDAALDDALQQAGNLPDDVIQHIYDQIESGWFGRLAASPAVSNVDCESAGIIAGVRAAVNFKDYADQSIGASVRLLQQQRACGKAIFNRIRQLISDGNRCANAEQERQVFGRAVVAMRYDIHGVIEMTQREIAEITGRPERTICDILKKHAVASP